MYQVDDAADRATHVELVQSALDDLAEAVAMGFFGRATKAKLHYRWAGPDATLATVEGRLDSQPLLIALLRMLDLIGRPLDEEDTEPVFERIELAGAVAQPQAEAEAAEPAPEPSTSAERGIVAVTGRAALPDAKREAFAEALEDLIEWSCFVSRRDMAEWVDEWMDRSEVLALPSNTGFLLINNFFGDIGLLGACLDSLCREQVVLELDPLEEPI